MVNRTVDGVEGWGPELDRSFKQQLFRFLEEIHSTKAVLYLLADDGRYVAVSRYGFGRRDRVADVHSTQDPMARRARELRTVPWAANDPGEADDLADYLEGAGTARILLVPLYADSRVVGFVDARDKGRKQPFDRDDLRRATDIASSIVTLIRSSGLYPDLEPPDVDGQATAVSDVSKRGASTLPVDRAVVAELRRAAWRLARLDGVAAVGVSVVTHHRAAALMVSSDGDRAMEHAPLLRHQEQALRSVGAGAPPLESWRLERTFVPGRHPTGDQIIASAVLDSGPDWAVVASAVVAHGDRSGEVVLEQLRDVWDSALRGCRVRAGQRAALRHLLAPGEHPYAELVAHSEAVSRLVWSMARHLGWDDHAVEDAALAGLLHDVGMRELEYDRLYRHPAPDSDAMRTYRRHPEVGAELLDGIASGRIVTVVRHHHERWDGEGYPGRLSGETIPELARMVHLAETWDVLTSPTSYRAPVSRADAEDVMRREAGHQFDPRLVSLLLDVVS